MAGAVSGVINRISEWWTRSVWGWLVVLGPMASYAILLVWLDVMGLGASDPLRYVPIDADRAFLPPERMVLYSVAGRLEYAIVASVFFLVACFSIIWSVPRILFAIRNPFGGLTGLILSVGSSAALYYIYLTSDYQLRQVFADDILQFGEATGHVEAIFLNLNFFGFELFKGDALPSEILARSRDAVYLVGNAAPWCLIVLAAKTASFEPRSYRAETPASLRERITVLQIAVVLAAANIVLSVAYTRSMVAWPPMLFEEELARDYSVAATRYTALWGALGTVLLITTLAPAYISLNRQFDRIACRELGADRGRRVTHEERYAWRRKHGLIVSAQQAITTGAAVIAPVMTSPTLDASQGIDRNDGADRAQTRQELRFDQR